MHCHGQVSSADASVIIRSIARYNEEIIDREKPILECELPIDGSRFEGIVPLLVPQPSFTIRKKATRVFTLDDYVAAGIMSPQQLAVIRRAIAERKNILVVGGTGSGKTTLVKSRKTTCWLIRRCWLRSARSCRPNNRRSRNRL